jgi:hypothetical protein
VARATAALGVRAVIASSYSGGPTGCSRCTVLLPLTWLEPADRREVRARGTSWSCPPPTGHGGIGTQLAVRTPDARLPRSTWLRPEMLRGWRAARLLRAMREARGDDPMNDGR